jgi:hypothetical protein
MYPDSIRALQADTLSVSALQRSDQLSASQIWQAAAAALDAYGGKGCAGPVTQEFGDHQETAAVRMRWARATVAALHGQPTSTQIMASAA